MSAEFSGALDLVSVPSNRIRNLGYEYYVNSVNFFGVLIESRSFQSGPMQEELS